MTKLGLCKHVARATGYPDKIARECIEAAFNEIMNQVIAGETVGIENFGVFKAKRLAEKISHTIDGRGTVIPEHFAPRFSPSQRFRDSVWNLGVAQ